MHNSHRRTLANSFHHHRRLPLFQSQRATCQAHPKKHLGRRRTKIVCLKTNTRNHGFQCVSTRRRGLPKSCFVSPTSFFLCTMKLGVLEGFTRRAAAPRRPACQLPEPPQLLQERKVLKTLCCCVSRYTPSPPLGKYHDKKCDPQFARCFYVFGPNIDLPY